MKLLDKIHKYKTMLSYCLKCKTTTKNINPKISVSSNGKTMILWDCPIWGSKKSKFIKQQEANRLLSSLGVKTLSKIALVGPFCFNSHYNESIK